MKDCLTHGCSKRKLQGAGREMLHADCHTRLPPQAWLPADPIIQGVMLAGGVLQDAMLAKQSASTVRTVFAPKVGHPT